MINVFNACAALSLLAGFPGWVAHGYGQSWSDRLPAPLTDADFYDGGKPDPEKIELGRLLFFDKVLSGNRNISCATCHHPRLHTGDALSLSIGEGGMGLGRERRPGSDNDGIEKRVARNAPPLFNLGVRSFTVLFHDGRIHPDPHAASGFRTPAHNALPPGLDNPLAMQALFPMTAHVEMSGRYGDNEIANAFDPRPPNTPHELQQVWDLMASRLQAIPEYTERMARCFEDVNRAGDISVVHVANALAAFMTTAFRSDQSPFDRYLRGESGVLDGAQQRGMQLFYGKAKCVDCHQGVLQTDLKFYAIGMPQLGPGKGQGLSRLEDYGREAVTGQRRDRYRFRTPPLRNVALTAPYGHSGAFTNLETVVRHHLDPETSLQSYKLGRAVLPTRVDLDNDDYRAMEAHGLRYRLSRKLDIQPVSLTNEEIRDLVAFLHSLTDPRMEANPVTIPDTVPSGLPVER